MTRRRPALLLALLPFAAVLAGCDVLGGDAAEKLVAQREAEGKAIGGACRHAGRAIEDCFAMNKRAEKASVFAGWREMNDYMRENKIEPIAPTITAKNDAKADAAEGVKAEAAESKPKAAGKKHES